MVMSPQDDPITHNGQEKQLLPGQGSHGINTNYRPSSYFPNGFSPMFFDVCNPCPPYEPQEDAFQPFTSTASFNYGSLVSVQPQPQVTQGSPMSSDPTVLYPCENAPMAQCLPNYPPLHPSPAMQMQAPAREVMAYPNISPTNEYPGGENGSRDDISLAIRSPPPFVGVSAGPDGLPSVYSSEVISPSVSRFRTSSMGPLPHQHPLQSHKVKDDPDVLDANGGSSSFDLFPRQRTLTAKRGPFKDKEEREKTARTRKMGSCIRCRMQRIRCVLDELDEAGPCVSCKKLASNNTKVYRLECLRWKITDVKLFKPGQVAGLEWTKRWRDSVLDDIGSWASSDYRTIRVTEGYTGKSVELLVREFNPQDGDKLYRTWVSPGPNGKRWKVEIPRYAIVNMEAAKDAFDTYIREGMVPCCQHFLDSRENLFWRTYSLAIHTIGDPSINESERTLLISTLNLWMSVRLTTKSFHIVGQEMLGMKKDIIKDPTSADCGKIPLPPVMGAQIDSILIHQIQPHLRQRTLEELQKLTQEKKTRTWLVTYLVTFILLHNIALITKHDADYAIKHALSTRFAREDNVKEYNLGANTLLAYFHYCNKGVYPFSADCRDQDLQGLAELNQDGMSLVKYTRQYASATEQQTRWEGLWDKQEVWDEFYYVSQLFEQNWQPRMMV
ncbi:hypothetical protein B0T19DRAFT_395938 [Cercophora scortea]|uniref:Zn(2)-C6 fungal-type domain-containing protein n=1 Tax=Cercophora scortea TaxID=314031 RepID=A0AAE0ML51_9PEZI|nr:hypothetical protein B0T19DRAFT_395938 [Cercophora scortea]